MLLVRSDDFCACTRAVLQEELATGAECAEVLGDMCAGVDASTSFASVQEVRRE